MKRYILILIVLFLIFWNREAAAFWGSDSSDTASGLNVSTGFDVNTISTVTGSVLSPPERRGEEQHTTMSIEANQGVVTAVLGPWSYWEKQTITITKNQIISITGSLAQGRDGALYLFVQRIENRSNGQSVTIRSESGRPFWSRGGSGIQNGTRQFNGNSPRSGAGSRGGGMRGGGR